ncbi:TPA: hypothetical protein ACH3X2_006533 [Trebouxia sp. C0005]
MDTLLCRSIHSFTAVRGKCLAAVHCYSHCRLCSNQSASSSGSDCVSALPNDTQRRSRNAQPLRAAASPGAGVVSERKATESLQETLQSRGPVKDLGFPRDFQSHYKLEEEIGKGAWATVQLATELKTGDKRAVKVLEKWTNKDGTIEEGFAVRIKREIATYQIMSGSLNVCCFYGAYETDKHLYLVTELCTGGQLWERVEAGRFSEAQAARIIREILQLLAQAHSRNIVIRDIKPDNLLFLDHSQDAPLKAIDFGIATICTPDDILQERCGSPVYVAPEVLQKRYGQKADVWSAGMVAYLLLCARLPWKGDQSITTSDLYVSMGDGKTFNRKDAFSALMFSELDFECPPWPQLSPDAKDFVQHLLIKDPAKRATALEALDHRWLLPEGTASVQPFDTTIVQRLQNFGTFSRTKKVALRAIVGSIAHDDSLVSEVREAFEELEHGHAGSVTNSILLQGLKDRGYTLQDNEAEQLVSHLDTDTNGTVDYLDWLAAMVDWHKVQQEEEWDDWVRQAFRSLDSNQDGVICEGDMRLTMHEELQEGDDGQEIKGESGSFDDPHEDMNLGQFNDLVQSSEQQQSLSMYNKRHKS